MITVDIPVNTPAGRYTIAPVAPEPVPNPQPPTRVPVGKGMFVWILSQCERGDPVQIANVAQAAGIKNVFIKVHQETWNYNNAPTDKLVSTITALKSAGINVWGWGYIKLNDPDGEARKAAERVKTLGLYGYAIDAESECKNKPVQTLAFCQRLKEQLSEPIGLCSYRYPLLHQEISWKTFWNICDFDMPQVYWLEANSTAAPGQQLVKSIAQFRTHGSTLPYYPVGLASPNDGDTWRTTVAQIDAFDSAVKGAGLTGTSWWSWQHARNIDPNWWAAIARHIQNLRLI